jgi:serine/threonine-protein kinase RsbW
MQREIKIKSSTENLREIEKFVDEVSIELELSDEIYGNILIATLEAANNAIIHGNKNQKEKDVLIEISKTKNSIVLRVQDQGQGFDYSNIPDPTSPENIEKINGRGVFLMKKLSDKMEYFEKGRIVQLTFTL